MNRFLTGNFLLSTAAGQRLFHEVAKELPIIDYHCHLDARSLADDTCFTNLTQLWIASDPYKHRAMRLAGWPEEVITGIASDRKKFQAWAATAPLTLGSPLYHWTALELQRYFGIDEPLCPKSAPHIWDLCNEMLASPEFTARRLLTRFPIEAVCTSNAPGDNLDAHRALADSGFSPHVIPTVRDAEPSHAECFEVFADLGCRIADHAIDTGQEFEAIRPLAAEYARRGWTMQLHLGAERRTSSRLRKLAGPAGGYATIGGSVNIGALCRFLDDLERDGALPRTILFSLNPADNAALATLTGSFAEDGVAGKIQHGPAWWFNDHALGIRTHIETLASYGLLSTFVGMTTDSRSLLSMTRHEYFRRLLCDWIGRQVEAGAFPDDPSLLDPLVHALSYGNAKKMLHL